MLMTLPLERRTEAVCRRAIEIDGENIPFFLFYHKSFKLKMPDFGRALKFVCDYCSSPPVSLSFWNVKFFCTTCPMLSSI